MKIKPNEKLKNAAESGLWKTSQCNKDTQNNAYNECDHVILLFSFNGNIQGLYRFVSSVVTTTRREDHEKSIRARTKKEVLPYALRTKHF